MKKIVIVVTLILAWNAGARLGETEKELKARYGTPVLTNAHPDRIMLCWFFKNREVCVVLREGKSVSEVVTASSVKDTIDLNQAMAIATNISGATNWVKSEAESLYFDAGRTNNFFHLEPASEQSARVVVTTREELARRKAEKEKSDKAAAEGF